MKSNLLNTPSTNVIVDLEKQTCDLLLSILELSPDAEAKLRKFSASISGVQIDPRRRRNLRRIEVNAATLLAVEKQLDPIHLPVFSMTGQDEGVGIPASESAQLRSKKKNLRLWARRRLSH